MIKLDCTQKFSALYSTPCVLSACLVNVHSCNRVAALGKIPFVFFVSLKCTGFVDRREMDSKNATVSLSLPVVRAGVC